MQVTPFHQVKMIASQLRHGCMDFTIATALNGSIESKYVFDLTIPCSKMTESDDVHVPENNMSLTKCLWPFRKEDELSTCMSVLKVRLSQL